MAGFISIDYDNAFYQAKQLETVTEECERICREMTKQIETLNQVWDGDASNAMISRLYTYIERNRNLQAIIRQTANEIRQVTNIIKSADEEAARRAKEMEEALNSAIDILGDFGMPSGGGGGRF